MKNKRGFVFIETIIVIVVLSAALLILYSAYNSAINDEKRRLFYDDTAYVYRNYHILDYLLAKSNIRDFFEIAHEQYFFPIGYDTENFFSFGRSKKYEDNNIGYLKSIFEQFNINRMLLVSSNIIENCYNTNDEACQAAYSKLYSAELIEYIKRLDFGKIEEGKPRMFLVIEYAEYTDTEGNVKKCEDNSSKCKYYYASVEITENMLNRFNTGTLMKLEGSMQYTTSKGDYKYYIKSSNTYFNYNLDKDYVRTINLVTYINYDDSNTIYIGDISEEKNGSIEMWYIEQNDKMIDLYIGTNSDTIKANRDSSFLFSGFKNLEEINGLDIIDFSETTSFSYMFGEDFSLKKVDLSVFDTSNLKDVSYMFHYCESITSFDFARFDTSNVTDFSGFFSHCTGLKNDKLDVSLLNTKNAEKMQYLFFNCSYLTKIKGLDSDNFNTSKVKNMSRMFYYCNALTEINVGSFDTSNVTDMHGMFSHCWRLNTLEGLNSETFNTSSVTDMSSMFYNCADITTINLAKFNTTLVTNMSDMFSHSYKINELDLSSFKTSIVTNMSGMFCNCLALVKLTLPEINGRGVGFDTFNVEDMQRMFLGCNIEAINTVLKIIDTSNVTNMSRMFENTNFIDLNLDNYVNFNTSNVTDMSSMFYYCNKLTNLKIGNFDTSNVTNMDRMFYSCSALTMLNLSNFKTQKVTNMGGMFYGCSNLKELDLSSFDTTCPNDDKECVDSNLTTTTYVEEERKTINGIVNWVVKSYDGMFEGCSALEKIYVTDKFIFTKVDKSTKEKVSTEMFLGATLLPNYNERIVDKEYARIDGKDGLPGYFTDISQKGK